MKNLNPQNRLYQLDRPVIAITGGIATGKSSVTKIIKEQGYQVVCADELVKSIYQEKSVITWVKENVPHAFTDDPTKPINFPVLREQFFKDSRVKEKLEELIYTFLPIHFLQAAKSISEHQKSFFYDVPLLFEKKLEAKLDYIVLVYAPRNIQVTRLMERDNISLELANSILDQQISIEEKKEKSDYLIDNSRSISDLKKNTLIFLETYRNTYEN